jgi:hypothetical protein
MKMQRLLFAIFFGITLGWSDELYTDTYMQSLKKFNTPVETGIKNGISGKTIYNGKYSKIIRFEPIYFNGEKITDISKESFQKIIEVVKKYQHKRCYVTVIGHTSDYIETGHKVKMNAWSDFWQNLAGRELTKEESISLANSRIKVVYNILKNHEVNPATIYVENRLGKDKISTEATREGCALNNRVDIALYIK